jgi:hypothetical protein
MFHLTTEARLEILGQDQFIYSGYLLLRDSEPEGVTVCIFK